MSQLLPSPARHATSVSVGTKLYCRSNPNRDDDVKFYEN
jgi:hypothetical protein